MAKVFVDGRHPNDFCRAMAEAMDRDGIPSFIVVLLPTRDKQRYDGIKTFLTTQIGIPSQCIRADVAEKGLSVITNLVIQIVSKTGGVPYRVSSTNLSLGSTMVVGLAIETSRGSAPVAAGVASRDTNMTQYFSDSASTQGTDTLIADHFIRDFMERALDAFNRYNGEYPARVVVYRDGVSYGQIVSASRRQEYVYARMIFSHHLRRRGYTYLRIGSLTRRHHSSVCHSVCRYEMDMAFNPAFRKLAEEVEKAMKPFMRQAGQKKR